MFTLTREQAWQKVLKIRNKTYGWCEEIKNKYIFDLCLDNDIECVVELGVYRGLSLCSFSAASLVKPFEVYGIDSYVNDLIKYLPQENLEESKLIVQKNFKEEELPCNFIFKSSLEASFDPIFENKQIDIIHIDASHTAENSLLDVLLWLPKLKSKGFLILDDANWQSLYRAKQITLTQCDHVCYLERDNKTQIFQKK